MSEIYFPDPSVEACECKSMERFAREGVYPIVYDEDDQMYVLTSCDGSEVAFVYYCFHCGGRVAEPVRLKEGFGPH